MVTVARGGDGEPMAMAAIDVEEEIDDIPEMVDINLTNGSAISQSFMGLAGDTVSMSWNYAARDYIPFTDPGFFNFNCTRWHRYGGCVGKYDWAWFGDGI